MKSKKLFIALILLISLVAIHASAENYGNTWWYHVAGGNSVARFESGVDTYSRYDDGHYLLFGSIDSLKVVLKYFGIDIDLLGKLYSAIDGDFGKFMSYAEKCMTIYDISTRPSSSYDAMKAYAANDGDWWYAVIWIPY